MDYSNLKLVFQGVIYLVWSQSEGCLSQAPTFPLSPASLCLFHFYQILLRPCLENASPVWDNCSSSDSTSLERTQLSLVRCAAFFHNLSPRNFSKSCLLELFRLADTCLAMPTIQANSLLASRPAPSWSIR